MFQRIVIGFDGTTEGHDALALALALAGEQRRLIVVCVHPLPLPSARARPGGGPGPRGEAEERLVGARAALEGRSGVELQTVPASSAAAGLHAVAESEEADLIVVGSSHRGALGRVFPGTTAAQVLNAAPCAVAVAPLGLHASGAVAIQQIGVGFDGGDESRRALEAAHRLAAEHGARLRVVSVIDTAARVVGVAGEFIWPEDLIEEANAMVAAAVTQLGDALPVDQQVLTGSPVRELAVASAEVDLLVLGSRGYGPVRRLLLGSVGAGVARGAACSLLVVPRAGS